MIGVYFQGRLGNQLFQYAFALSESKKLNTDFFMDESNDSMLIRKYFELRSYSYLKSRFKRLMFGKNKPVVELDNAKSFSENKLLLGKDNCFYKGFYQSELYFKDVYADIQKEFTLKAKHRIDVRKYLNISNDKPLFVLHVRRTDYLNHGDDSLGGKDLSLPIAYYHACLKSVKDLQNYNVVFVTDDSAFVKSNFEAYHPIISSNKKMIVDFQIFLCADVLAIANSSFSWWGAYLNTNCKKVFAPKYWLGFLVKKEYPLDVVAASWEQIELN